MSIDLKYASDARNKMADGIKKLYDAVKVTIGPKGRNVIIEQDFGAPLITNDGVTIAKAIELNDKYENLGASILLEAASKTNDFVGDGTTTAIILSSALILNGLKEIENGVNPVDIRKGMEYYLPIIIDEILKVTTPVNSIDDLRKIAFISSGNKLVADYLASAYTEVGINGIISLQESSNIETTLEVTKGYSFDRGYLSVYLTNNGEDKIELDNPLILITDKKITITNEILPHLEESIKKNKPLLIICEDMDTSVLNTLIVNKLRGVFNVAVVKTPSYGEKKTKQLEDIAIFTNGKYINSQLEEEVNLNVFGSAEKVIITKDQTSIINGSGSDEDILKRANQLKQELQNTTSVYEKEKLEERIAKLLGGVAIIKVGAPTEPELKELKLRIEDAINATKAASKKGVIAGGGKVFYQISEKLKSDKYQYALPAKNIIVKALEAPFKQIIDNAGININITKNFSKDKWINVETEEIVDLKEAGVIDPASVAISSITNAISVAGVFLTTECAIIKNETNKTVNEENLL